MSDASTRAQEARDAMHKEDMRLGAHWEPTQMTRTALRLGAEAVGALVAELERVTRERDQERIEVGEQMTEKLRAQMALKAITEALDLDFASLGNGWTEGSLKILARIETIVDEADRGFRERDAAQADVTQLREALKAAADKLGVVRRMAVNSRTAPNVFDSIKDIATWARDDARAALAAGLSSVPPKEPTP